MPWPKADAVNPSVDVLEIQSNEGFADWAKAIEPAFATCGDYSDAAIIEASQLPVLSSPY